MADSSPERPQADQDDVLELNKDLEKMTECAENMSVQLTWMAYDLVALRTSPELGALLQGLEEAYDRCRAAVCGARSREPVLEDRMENTEKTREQAPTSAYIGLEIILKGLDSMSNCMNQLALRTQLKQCDLIVCVGSPDKLPCLKNPSGTEAAAASLT